MKNLLLITLTALFLATAISSPAYTASESAELTRETYYFYDSDMRLFGCTVCGSLPPTLNSANGGGVLLLTDTLDTSLGLRKVEDGYVSVVITTAYYYASPATSAIFSL